MKLKIKNYYDILIIFFIYLVFLIAKNIVTTDEELKTIILYQKILNLLIYSICFYKSYRKLENNYFIFFFLIALFIFNYSRINFLGLFTNEIESYTWFSNEKYTLEMKLFVVEILFLNIAGIYCGIKYCIVNQKKKEKNKIEIKKNVITVLMYITIATGIIYYYGEINFLKNMYSSSYQELYKLGKLAFKNNTIINIISIFYRIFVFSGLAICTDISAKKYRKFFIFNYITIYLFYSLTGSRGYIIAGLFFIVSYYLLIYKKKLKLKLILVTGIILMIFSQEIIQMRNKEKQVEKTVIIKLYEFMYQQGVTGTFLATPISHPEIYKGRGRLSIFAPILKNENGKQDEENIKIVKEKITLLGSRIAIYMNENLYLMGAGTGGNYILEMFALGGKFGIYLLSIFYTIVLYKMTNYLNYGSNFFIKYLTIAGGNAIFWAPRSSYIPYAPVIKELIVLIGMVIYYKILMKNKKRGKYEQ